MPLYESRKNAENLIKVSAEVAASVVCGTPAVIDRVCLMIEEVYNDVHKQVCVALDGWVGVDYVGLAESIARKVRDKGLRVQLFNIYDVYLNDQSIRLYKQPFITSDPGFGWANIDGHIESIMDVAKVQQLVDRLQQIERADLLIVYGPGCTISPLASHFGLRFYCEMTRQPLLWKMWDGSLIPLAAYNPSSDYNWKEYYYCDYYLLHNHKEQAIRAMDYYIEAIDTLKMLPRSSYDTIIQTLVQYPIKEVKIFQPGPWGAYRYKDLWDVPGLECNAWNELAGPELSVLIDLGAGFCLNLPFVSLMQYAEQLVGAYIARTYPGLFPMDIWLDDGFFPEKTPAERISMPIHNHPDTAYVNRHFNEPIGRYETYYIAEAYEGANTWMGYKENCDLEAWEAKCRQSNNLTPITDWQDYINNWPSVEGDLYLIPPGTAHGHGGNQMVLEMDTCPSIAGTEYSFFLYDFARNSWDDTAKTMTGRPLKMHLEHGFDHEKWRREQWVKEHLLARPQVVQWTRDYSLERFASTPEMPFEIERFRLRHQADNDTQGRFMHILTLTVGERVRIISRTDPERSAEIECFQSAVVPAAFGEYSIINLAGGTCTVVQLRWKQG